MEWIGAFLYNLSAFVLIISVIVFIHEYGHYLVAKLSGVKIEAFSIGFGPELFGWNDKSGTRWKVSVLPFGGYVKMFGDIDPSSAPDMDKIEHFSEEDKKRAFHTKPLAIKAAVVVAGPVANFILAIAILTFFYAFYGKPVTQPIISDVMAKSAAQEAGLKQGDRVLAIDGSEVASFDDIQRIVSLNTGTAMYMHIKRDGKERDVVVTPKIEERKDMFGNAVRMPLLGITSQVVNYQKLHSGVAVVEATKETYFIASSTLKAIGQIITGRRGTDELSGPIRIAKYSGQSLEKGVTTVLWFMVVLSVNLGLINLFPIPVLDGGHLFYYAVEAVRGKPMADRLQQYGFRIGLAFIICLALFSTVNDLRNLNVF